MSPDSLVQVLCQLDQKPQSNNANVLVGFDLMDDAGVYKLNDEMALVQTVDFFTPIVDEPYLYGQIAAANALSDIYAMGGKPLTALSIACFPTTLDPKILAEILDGGMSKIKESGAVLLGGHTVTDEEIKYGLSVTGTVHPSKILSNAGAKPGDALILTKPIGTGILTTALKFDILGENQTREATEFMATLNRDASEAAQKIGVNACTDITGFGLLGHSYELAAASNVNLKIELSSIPVMANVIEMIQKEAVPGGAFSNMSYFKPYVAFDGKISESDKIIVFDPQTSGGLLISVDADKAKGLRDEINKGKQSRASIIGYVDKRGNDNQKYITVF